MHANEMHEQYDRHHKVSPIANLILTIKTGQVILSSMKLYENDEKIRSDCLI